MLAHWLLVAALPLALALGRAAAAGEQDPARGLPATATVCQDRTSHRCWSVPGESFCVAAATPRATVFRTVIAAPGRTDVATALRECEQELSEMKTPAQ